MNRDGFVIGEGGAALVLEELEHALSRGAKDLCRGRRRWHECRRLSFHGSASRRIGRQTRNETCHERCRHYAAQIDYINVHGTSTPVGDPAELKGIAELFGDAVYGVNISSTKSMTGHLLGGAGAVEALACIMAITKGIVPPTINVEELDPQIDPKLNLTLGTAQKRDVKYAMSNTFGFGGHNSTIILKKYE